MDLQLVKVLLQAVRLLKLGALVQFEFSLLSRKVVEGLKHVREYFDFLPEGKLVFPEFHVNRVCG